MGEQTGVSMRQIRLIREQTFKARIRRAYVCTSECITTGVLCIMTDVLSSYGWRYEYQCQLS